MKNDENIERKIQEKFDSSADSIYRKAIDLSNNSGIIELEHFILAIYEKEYSIIERKLGFKNTIELKDYLYKELKNRTNMVIHNFNVNSDNLKAFFCVLYDKYRKNDKITTENIIETFIEENKFVEYMEINNKVSNNEIKVQKLLNLEKKEFESKKDFSINKLKFPNLINIGTNITEEVYNLKNKCCIGREEEIETLIELLCLKQCNNVLILGEAGVGKTELVNYLAWEILNNKNITPKLEGYQIFQINPADFSSGTKYVGEIETKVKKIINECINSKIILFIDEIHSLTRSGGTSKDDPINVSQILKPLITSNNIKIIGATTNYEFEKYIASDIAFSRRFQKLTLSEPNKNEAFQILKGLKKSYEDEYKNKINDKELNLIIDLSDKYIKNFSFPDKAIKVMDRAFAKSVIEKNDFVQENHIHKAISEIANIPIEVFYNLFGKKINELEKKLKNKIISQEDAINKIIKSLKINFSIFSQENNRGTFLFTGPTGVGKTETAKNISEKLYGEKKLLKLDMSEYSSQNSYRQLIGASVGLVGSEEGGILTNWVKANPYGVIIFDEIEKAHKEVHNLLLQILDSGTLTDNKNNTVFFKEHIIILTSNIFAKNTSIGFNSIKNKNQSKIYSLLEEYFSKELIGRVNIIEFNQLEKNDFAQIIEEKLDILSKDFENNGKNFTYVEGLIYYLIEKITLQMFGVRELQRIFQEEILYPISLKYYDDLWDTIKNIQLSIISGKIYFNFS